MFIVRNLIINFCQIINYHSLLNSYFIQGILDGADLDKITMKIVCRNIYDLYPDHDLTGKKDFIKNTVKKLIS